MTIRNKIVFALLCLSTASPLFSKTGSYGQAAAASSQDKAKSSGVHASPQDDGQKIFDQNCSRCHNAPMGFSPRISGTVVRHMRVRAGLSEKDAQALMRFFNP
jgi:cytochrome c5